MNERCLLEIVQKIFRIHTNSTGTISKLQHLLKFCVHARSWADIWNGEKTRELMNRIDKLVELFKCNWSILFPS